MCWPTSWRSGQRRRARRGAARGAARARAGASPPIAPCTTATSSASEQRRDLAHRRDDTCYTIKAARARPHPPPRRRDRAGDARARRRPRRAAPRRAPARCLSVAVPLDRTRRGAGHDPHPRRADPLAPRRPPAAHRAHRRARARPASIFASSYDYILPTAGRDLVVLDQRGTGASGLLRCRSLERRIATSFSRAAGACGRSLGARRSFYTSADSADDIEALRIRLGVPRIALYAVSYGTRVAVEYARRYPRARRADDPRLARRDRRARLARPRDARRRRPGPARRSAARAAAARRPIPSRTSRGSSRACAASPIRRVVRRGGRRVPVSRRRRRPARPARLQRPRPVVHAPDPAGRARGASRGNSGAARAAEAQPLRRRLGRRRRERVSEFSPAVYAATTCEESTFAWDPAAGPRDAPQPGARGARRDARRPASRRSTAARR